MPVLSKGLPPPLLSFMPVSEKCSDEVVELAPPVDAGDGVLEVSSTRALDVLLDVAAAEVADGALVEGTIKLDKGVDVSATVLVAESTALDVVATTAVVVVTGAVELVSTARLLVSGVTELAVTILLITVDSALVVSGAALVLGAGVLVSSAVVAGALDAGALEAGALLAPAAEPSGAFLHKLCGPSPVKYAPMIFSPPLFAQLACTGACSACRPLTQASLHFPDVKSVP